MVCADCRSALLAPPPGSKAARLTRAILFGSAAGLVGSIVWYLVRVTTGYEIGLIAVGVGLFVGKAVRAGARNRGGVGYQVAAVVITYIAICLNYAPDIVKGLMQQYKEHHPAKVAAATPATTSPQSGATLAKPSTDAPPANPGDAPKAPVGAGRAAGALVVLTAIIIALCLAAPVLMGFRNFIGLLIIAFALWEAWKINKAVRIDFTGPHSLEPGMPAQGAT